MNPQKCAADRIIKIIEVPGAVDVVDLINGKLKVVGCRLTERGPLIGKRPKNLKTEGRYPIGAVYRGGSTLIPQDSTVLEKGDLVFAITRSGEAENLMKLLKGAGEKPGNRVVIVGGGDIGYILAKHLEGEGYQVKVFERKEERCTFLAEKLEKTIVINGDGTDRDLLMEENISDTDTFIAVTDDEEANILTSLLAKRLGAERCITLIDKPEYLSMVSTIGIDVAVSPRLCSVSGILQFVRRGKVLSVTALMEERVEALETVALETSDIVDVPLKDIKFPQGAIIGAVVKDDKVMLPDGETVIKPGDKVVILALTKVIPKVEKAVTVKPEYF
jgi:trk system potassium uptake protein TrkA